MNFRKITLVAQRRLFGSQAKRWIELMRTVIIKQGFLMQEIFRNRFRQNVVTRYESREQGSRRFAKKCRASEGNGGGCPAVC